MQIETLYQEIILDHYKNPRGAGLRGTAPTAASAETVSGFASASDSAHGVRCAQSHQVNPTCGDEVTVRVELADGKISDISYDATGCSISQAAASVLYEQLQGVTLERANGIRVAFTDLVSGRTEGEPDEDLLGDGIAFAGVAQYPARVKCALLPWMAFVAAAAQVSNSTS